MFAGITLLILGVVTAIVSGVDPTYNSNQNDWGNTLIGVWGLITIMAWIVAAVGTAVRSVQSRRARKRTTRIDETIRDRVPSPDQASVESIRQVVEASVSQASQELIDQRARRLKTRRLVLEGRAELSTCLPDLPRSIKRVANRHYLLTSMAVSRNMMGVGSSLTPAHLAKWALIMERWPHVAGEIIEDPACAGELERAAAADARSGDGSGDDALLGALGGLGLHDVRQLSCLLRDGATLAPVADQLAFARPASAVRSPAPASK
jgi:hypothetical protein